MSYREIRVRPVVRYIVTDFSCDDDMRNQQSIEFGEFDNVERANTAARAMVGTLNRWHNVRTVEDSVRIETARKLKIDWTRGPGEPKSATKWHLIDVDTSKAPRSEEDHGVVEFEEWIAGN